MNQLGCNIEFRLYPGIGHTYAPETIPDIFSFFDQIRENYFENDTGIITPEEATIGTETVLSGSKFGNTPGMITIGNVKFKTITWSDSSVRWLMKKPMSPGVYDVTVIPKEPKGAAPVVFPSSYTVKSPEINSINSNSASIGQTITVMGSYFGSKKGNVYLVDGSEKRIKCKVGSWTMDSQTNDSEIVFAIPKKVVSGNYDIQVINKIGADTLENALNVE
jgi:hypothetical protein